jgi:8-amino-7-oxononanoate synthase
MTTQSASKKPLSAVEKQALLKRIIETRKARTEAEPPPPARVEEAPESFYKIDKFPQYSQMQLYRALADKTQLSSPFFIVHEGVGRDTTRIGGREYINFSTYNYLGLNGDPRVTQAAHEAALRYGTSASASRIVGGERPPHRALERALAGLHGTEDAVVFVSGYLANVAIISTLAGPKDLVVMDRLSHNSIITGAKLSTATLQTFPHNDWQALDDMLASTRGRFERVLIIAEGIYSMEGDICPLPELIEIKRRHKALLMVDEAHSAGVLGATGRGAREHFGVDPADIDVWMGTLSKTFAGCGGYAAGSFAMVELMKFQAGGFLFSVGMPPPMAAASLAACQIMLEEHERVTRLAANGQYFLKAARAAGLNTGGSAGVNIVPAIVGSSVTAARVSNALAERGIQANPVVFPAVEERAARIRFFLSSEHTAAEMDQTIDAVAEEIVNHTAPG